jgi:hypothetical protein
MNHMEPRLTAHWYSGVILEKEWSSIRNDSNSFQVKVFKSPTGGAQICASYKLEDADLALNISFPLSYPLRPVTVTGGERVAISEPKWRAWQLACKSMLATQNSTIQDALETFHKNIQLHLQGISECAICYSIVGVLCKSLPNKACKTCRTIFHAACLYKVIYSNCFHLVYHSAY